jgi:ubiquinone biosynthesis protein
MPPSIVGIAIRDLARLRRVATTISRHGFGELLMRTSLGRRIFATGEVPASDASLGDLPTAVRFTKLLVALGPTYIKLGQVMSMRRDVLPAPWIDALSTLQDRAPKVEFEEIRKEIERGLGAPVADLFSELDPKPLATASIAQTHLAETREGRRVVVKVQRPGIEETIRSDLDLLYLATNVLEASIEELRVAGIAAMVEEFE